MIDSLLLPLCFLLLLALLAALWRCRNLSDSARSNRAAAQSLKRLSLVASRTTNGVVITDAEGRVEWVNDGFTRITGYGLEEVRGRKPGSVLQGAQTDPATVARLGAALRRAESCEAELLNFKRNGQPYWIQVSVDPMWDEQGRLQGFMGIETDISARKAAEAKLGASVQHSQAVLDNVIDGIITIDGRGVVASFNRAAESIFGYPASAVIGRNVNMLMPEPYRSEHDNYLHNYQHSGMARVIGIGREVTGLRQDGGTFQMELSVTEITRDEQPFYIGLVRDITERKRLEQMKREFIATVSHELRTPLTSIRGALGLVASGTLAAAPEQLAQLIGIAHKNSERLTHLINDLLDMEKMAAGGMRFDMRVQPLMPLIDQSLEAIRSYGEPCGVSFHLIARADDVAVCVDAQRLLQVMANLLSNAAKFSPAGGEVEISVIRHDPWVRVAVRDHGGGIPASFHDQIFNKFCQADASDTRQSGGTGLGLAISKELVERMQGRIGFESREGDGAMFHVDLSLARAADSTAAVMSPSCEIVGAPRLLVVEDNREVSDLLVLMLQRAGFNADAAYDGTTALALIAERSYAAITLDLLLPDRSGVSIIQQLRGDPATAQLPIIVLSAHLDGGRLALNGELNAIDWLEKPIDEARLLASVRNAIPRTALRDEQARVLHVEDDVDLHRIVAAISRDIAQFDHASTLAEARDCLQRVRYEVVMLDLDLPDGSGWELVPQLHALDPAPKVIILSASETSALKAESVVAALVKSRLSNEALLATLRRLIQ